MDVPTNLYELYAEFGIAAEKAQVLEVEAGNVALSFLALFAKTDQITDEQREMFRSIVDDVNRKTLGALLKHIKTIGTFDQAILDAVDKALEQRNYLTHNFFRSHNFAILNEEGRKVMVEELKDIQKKLSLAHAMLCGVSSTLIAMSDRTGLSEKITENLVTRGKRVEI
jgi:hypothetical protein